jgi:hypothetical protein
VAQAAPVPSKQPPSDRFTARLGERTRTIPLIPHPDGGVALRADALAEGLGGQLVRDAARPGRYRLEVGAVGVDIEHGSALAIVEGDTLPLSGEVFRSGATWQRGNGRVFYFRPGHETYPTYHHTQIQRVISNAVHWAKPTVCIPDDCPNSAPLEPLPIDSEAAERPTEGHR